MKRGGTKDPQGTKEGNAWIAGKRDRFLEEGEKGFNKDRYDRLCQIIRGGNQIQKERKHVVSHREDEGGVETLI